MGRLLEPLDPLLDALMSHADPVASFEHLTMAVETNEPEVASAVVGSGRLGATVLRRAGVLGEDGLVSAGATRQLDIAWGALITRLAPHDSWHAVMTVPAYLRSGLPEGAVDETLPVWRRLLTRATRRVVIASPFLDAGFAQLVPALGRFTANGGDVLLVTRALRDWRDGEANREAVQRLREACAEERLDVVSWNEDGLGLHMKVLVVDSTIAYVGSANFTWGGMGSHAELGVELGGPSVLALEALVDALAGALRARKGPGG